MKIVFTGGGSGGHVSPLIAIIREIRRIYPKKDLEFYYVGPKDELGLIMLSQENIVIQTIMAGKIRRYFSLQNFVDILFKIPFGFLQSLFILMAIGPNLIFSKGGSGSIAVTYAAKFLKIPVFIHESDVVPGLSNQKTADWAKKIFTSFPKTEYFEPTKINAIGNPIKKELLEGDRQKAGEIFDLTFTKPIFLVIGGSQGAEPINEFILEVLNEILKRYEIIHVAGKENFDQVRKEAQVVIDADLEKYYHPIEFLDEEKTKHAYAAADLIVSRAGSSAIFEIAACGKPSILIPLPGSAGDHQSRNAYQYSESGACVILEQQNLTPNIFMENVELLLLHSEKVEEMRQAAYRFAKPLAARAVAREILEFLTLE
jgi:UDP-N-acetylglucosamine--N-acetylmuramyl-(pentapeptide) pyrophosphoryl-undecaprenol N-acetylglucosamine transferase